MGPQGRTGDIAEMGHFKSGLALEMGYRQKCQIVGDAYQNFGEILVNPFVSKNDPSDS